jgi:uncharacterized repeat protein (TIGR01451 family)
MNKIIRNSLSSTLLLVLSACNLFGPPSAISGENSVLRLTVQTQNNVSTFSQAGETINYQYVITNTGTTPLGGPVDVTDSPRLVACPELNTVGNLDNYLDQNETVTCAAAYSITEADVNTGSVTTLAVATAGGITSNQTGITLTRGTDTAEPSSVLTLTKTASSQTYGQIGETITYMYVITNVGAAPLGPAQFTISDNKLGAPFNCGPDATTIAPGQTLSCSAPYLITEADMAAANVMNSATASGAGQTSAAATVTIANLLAPATATPPIVETATLPPSSNLAPGSTIQHQVAVGEWLIQIGRCYGATFDELRNANPQIADPDFILPSMIVTVPRIGSAGTIYGPPCITFHTVQSGDTWASIAQRYNADLAVLQRVNPAGLTVGTSVKIPLNSAGSVSVTAAPPSSSATPSVTTVAPMRITFDPGQNTASRIGILNPDQTIQYIVAATEGQMLTIQLSATPNEVNLGVNGPTGLALKQPDPTYTWSATITTGGDHLISLASILGSSSQSYTLQVSLTTPTTPDPASATSTTP